MEGATQLATGRRENRKGHGVEHERFERVHHTGRLD